MNSRSKLKNNEHSEFSRESEIAKLFLEKLKDLENIFNLGNSHSKVDLDNVLPLSSKRGAPNSNHLTLVSDLEGSPFLDVLNKISKIQNDVLEYKKKFEEAQKKIYISTRLSTIGSLTAGLAHELNNPITIVEGHCNCILDELSKESISFSALSDMASAQQNGIRRVKNIVEGLKIFLRRKPGIQERFDVNQVVVEINSILKDIYHKDNIQLDFDNDRRNPYLLGSVSDFQMILLNLISNARDAILEKNEPGKIVIQTYQKENEILLTISDTGCGISEEERDFIFDIFYTTKDRDKGSGIGLSIVFTLVNEMNGSITFESTKGKGTVFTLSFPMGE